MASKLSSLKEVLLDLRGRYSLVVSSEGETLVKKFDWANALADSAIVAVIGAFTTYASCLTASVPTVASVHTAVVAGVLQFATFLGIKRGIVKQTE